MLPRHLVPLAIGLVAFIVSEAATESPRNGARVQVRCAAGSIAVSARDAVDSSSAAAACTLARFDDRAAAEAFIRRNFAEPGARCACP